MRFLIGIITGTILTLFIATSLDAPTHPTLELARTQIERLWDVLIDTTSDSLFKVEEAQSAPAKRTEGPTPWASEQPVLPERQHAAPDIPVIALEAPEQLPPPPPAQALKVTERVTESGIDEETGQPAAAPGSVFEAPDDPDYLLQAPLELAAVWVPFHSQMSAEGFAARLSRELDHSFRVERQGAGAYQVVFDSTSPVQRDMLLAQIAEITGR
jgi:hypothetical protein